MFDPLAAIAKILPPPGPPVSTHWALDELMPQTTTSINNVNRKKFFTDIVPFIWLIMIVSLLKN